ncbi:hypothetical protein FQN54_004561 [Arachnomyces sp. PD_36]|nr:hypothetical protein FQN54_004561 [Arachnomyces sp. PD_36]
MADDTAAAEDSPITFHVKPSTDPKYTFTLSPSTTVLDLKNKLSGSDYADVPADRQRLIYSGRVLKDGDTLAAHKVKDGHTIHLVKSAPSQPRATPQAASNTTQGSSTSSSQPIPTIPSNLATGTGNNPLAGLTGARYAGFAQLPGAGMFGPDGGMGPPPDPEQMITMLENPQFQSTMNEALQNPQLIDMMIQQNPMLRDMGPGVRQMMQSPAFRRMLTDPNSIRQMTQMQRAMGMGDAGQPGGNAAFPAPGVTNTTPEENRQNQETNTNQGNTTNPGEPPFNPFAAPGQQGNPFAAGNQGNPFAALFGGNPAFGNNPAATGGQTQGQGEGGTGANPPNPLAGLFNPPAQQGAGDGTNTSQPPDFMANLRQNNPFLQNPALLNQMMETLGGQNQGGAGAGEGAQNPLAALWPQMAGGAGGFGAPQAPADNRPPEERYEEQLRQLNDMGFYEFDRNVEALRRSGGSVQGAVEYLLTH